MSDTITFDGTPDMARRVGLSPLAWATPGGTVVRPTSPQLWAIGSGSTVEAVAKEGDHLLIDPQGRAVGIADKETP